MEAQRGENYDHHHRGFRGQLGGLIVDGLLARLPADQIGATVRDPDAAQVWRRVVCAIAGATSPTLRVSLLRSRRCARAAADMLVGLFAAARRWLFAATDPTLDSCSIAPRRRCGTSCGRSCSQQAVDLRQTVLGSGSLAPDQVALRKPGFPCSRGRRHPRSSSSTRRSSPSSRAARSGLADWIPFVACSLSWAVVFGAGPIIRYRSTTVNLQELDAAGTCCSSRRWAIALHDLRCPYRLARYLMTTSRNVRTPVVVRSFTTSTSTRTRLTDHGHRGARHNLTASTRTVEVVPQDLVLPCAQAVARSMRHAPI